MKMARLSKSPGGLLAPFFYIPGAWPSLPSGNLPGPSPYIQTVFYIQFLLLLAAEPGTWNGGRCSRSRFKPAEQCCKPTAWNITRRFLPGSISSFFFCFSYCAEPSKLPSIRLYLQKIGGLCFRLVFFPPGTKSEFICYLQFYSITWALNCLFGYIKNKRISVFMLSGTRSAAWFSISSFLDLYPFLSCKLGEMGIYYK